MITLQETKREMARDPKNWKIYLADFADDFRRGKDPRAFSEPLKAPLDRWDSLLASTLEMLCQKTGIPIPSWTDQVPAVKDPWFVAGLENLKAIALAESPLAFRIRKIFVTSGFLSRV